MISVSFGLMGLNVKAEFFFLGGIVLPSVVTLRHRIPDSVDRDPTDLDRRVFFRKSKGSFSIDVFMDRDRRNPVSMSKD